MGAKLTTKASCKLHKTGGPIYMSFEITAERKKRTTLTSEPVGYTVTKKIVLQITGANR